MSFAPQVSVVVASHGRPGFLARTVTGVAQVLYPSFEVVVVADTKGVGAVAALPFADQIKTVVCDAANISAARNLGIAQAAGEIIAFIDDDAVPEPTWLTQLGAPFENPAVAAVGGFVIGRNGISLQWGAREVDDIGQPHALALTGDAPRIIQPTPGRAIKTEGTNCAFRRRILAELGGFDPNYRFYLDETDLNMRLAQAGYATAIAPRALVHHGFAPSERRAADRAPRSLFDIGASSAVFARKFASAARQADAMAQLAVQQKQRAVAHMVAGRIEPGRVTFLMQSLRDGIDQGSKRPLAPLPALPAAGAEFRAFRRPGATGQTRILAGRFWQARRLRKRARKLAGQGDIVTLFLFSPTALFHHHRFDEAGFWEQRGGLFGRSARSGRLFRMQRFATRVAREARRIAQQRGHGA